MSKNKKIIFWINLFFLHYCLAYYLKSQLNAEFFAIIDTNSKPKEFFVNQKLVDFEKTWFFHDEIKKNYKPDLEYLSKFEKKYKINLWKIALNERFFYKHNKFYNFSKEEILSILEQELKLYEFILDETKPDYFLTYDPPFHHQKLFLELCRIKNIKVLSICGTGIQNKVILTSDGATFDLDKNVLKSYDGNIELFDENKVYDKTVKNYLKKRETNFSDKSRAIFDYLINSNSNVTKTNFMYYGKNKFKVLKNSIYLEIKKQKNLSDLKKLSITNPNLNLKYVYFPMNVDEEMNTLHYAPFYTDQIEVITHIARSLPIEYVLYVKEHYASKLRGWQNKKYYQQIAKIPNVVLVDPLYDNNTLIKKSQLLVSIRGTSSLKALHLGIPSVIFGNQAFEILPSIFKIESVDKLPEIIKKALNRKVQSFEYNQYINLLNHRLIDFNMFEYESRRDEMLFSGKILSDVYISEYKMKKFIDLNKNQFVKLNEAHLKLI